MKKRDISIVTFLGKAVFTLAFLNLHSDQGVDASSAHVIINEVLVNPDGTDTGKEWIELYNTSDEIQSLDGWHIDIAGTEFKQAARLSETEIAAHTYFLICEQDVIGCNYYVSKLAFQNGVNATDGIKLYDKDNTLIDTLLYDIPNVNKLKDDNGIIAPDTETALNPGSAASLGRLSFIDTNNSFADFSIFTKPTPGTDNVLPDYTDKAIISEIAPRPGLDINMDGKIDSDDDYIEILIKSTDIDISDWYIKKSLESTKKYKLPSLTYPILIVNQDNSSIMLNNDSDCLYLYSPDHKLQDGYCYNSTSPEYSYCRVEIIKLNLFEKCNFTFTQGNQRFEPETTSLKQIKRSPDKKSYYSRFCVIYSIDQDKKIISDKEAGAELLCGESCQLNQCYLSQIEKTSVGLEIKNILRQLNEQELEIALIDTTGKDLDDYEDMYISLRGSLVNENAQLFLIEGANKAINIDTGENTLEQGYAYSLAGILHPFSTSKSGETKYELLSTEIINKDYSGQKLAATGSSIINRFLLFGGVFLAFLIYEILLNYTCLKNKLI